MLIDQDAFEAGGRYIGPGRYLLRFGIQHAQMLAVFDQEAFCATIISTISRPFSKASCR